MARSPRMNRRFTLSVKLEIPDVLMVGSGEVAENVLEAIVDYDSRHRLVNAVMEDGSETLIAVQVGLEEVGRVRDTTAALEEKLERGELEDPTPFWNEYRAECDQWIDLNAAIDTEIERLRDVQEKLNTAYDEVSRAEEKAEFRKTLGRLRRVIKSTEKALGPEVIARAPEHD